MEEIKLKAYGKINLGLDVLRKRPDGYHDLEMIMQTVGVYDDIVIKKIQEENKIIVETDAMVLPNDEGNLAYRAAKLLMDEFEIKQGLSIYIKKRIPIAGGMAGGSADCAAVLNGVNTLLELGLNEEQLKERGVTLGADVPYCVMGGTAIARGIGEKLTRLPSPPQCHVVIAKPGISVSTAYVYGRIKAEQIEKRPDTQSIIHAIKNKDLEMLASKIYNVMEEVTVEENPVITEIENVLKDGGALNAIMSGSGPTVFALFDNEEKAKTAVEALKEAKLTEQLYLTEFVN